MSDHITTYSKINFSPLNPKKEEIEIRDIAHALSLLVRANGHFPEFFSVGQHSIACCEEALARGYTTKVSLAGLLHDASEAYMSDVTRPIKQFLTAYLDAEKKLQDTIYHTFLGSHVTESEAELVKRIDDTMLYHEFLHYMDQRMPITHDELLTKPHFAFVNFKEIEDRYTELFYNLREELKLEKEGDQNE